MESATVSRQHLHQLVEQLPATALADAMQYLEDLTQRINQAAQEVELLSIIQRRLPDSQQARWQKLQEQLATETLDDRAYQEFLTYSDLLEAWNAERVGAIATLAQLRQVDFQSLYAMLTPPEIEIVL
ncbi:hypothetical protein VB712_17445 [Spirulina sp. CCNP1310]|uniref:hypothetical protein n=1 Tax=Spirulina sp. CCNP1310 TaxID=3110249 RepID=UPI002B20AA02|nr:hypothetical protein [Spirulina sp. CCNP1310]MEA5421013.1 hypothetical protein [Spirulina sp. CCNP1310]